MSQELRRIHLLWDEAASKAVAGAVKAKLGAMEDYRDSLKYILAHSKYSGFALDVIHRYEEAKRERSIFRRYYRWRDR